MSWHHGPVPSRRSLLAGGGGLLALGLTAAGNDHRDGQRRARELSFGATVATTGQQPWRASRRNVSVGELGLLVRGRRTIDGPLAAEAVDAQDALLAGVPLDLDGPHGGLLTEAALDLWVLSWGLPVAVAGWEGRWRYAWPRDTAHVAVALQALGDAPGAVRQMHALSRLVVGDHVEARYLPDGGTPDGRHPQSDGMGWVLWSAGRTVDDWLGSSARDDVAALVRRCARLALGQVRASGLPRPSPDYWEVDAPRLTLGTAAPILVGLEHAELVLARLGGEGDLDLADRCGQVARRLETAMIEVFGAAGWPRQRGRLSRDASIAFMLPPYRAAGRAEESLRSALESASRRMARSNGGYAPGEDWRGDGVAWTPEVALLAGAWASSADSHDQARDALGWLAVHRTRGGSLPEKVLHDGTSAGPAPLAWTAAVSVLAVETLAATTPQGQPGAAPAPSSPPAQPGPAPVPGSPGSSPAQPGSAPVPGSPGSSPAQPAPPAQQVPPFGPA